MGYSYHKDLDRMVGHDYPGLHSNGFLQFVIDEIELGARVAIALDDPEQWWREIHREQIEADLGR